MLLLDFIIFYGAILPLFAYDRKITAAGDFIDNIKMEFISGFDTV